MSASVSIIPDSHKSLLDSLGSACPGAIEEIYTSSGDVFVRVSAKHLLKVCASLRDDYHFIYLTDVFGIDRYTEDERFEVAYNLLDLRHGRRLILKTRCTETHPVLDSVTAVWPNANWSEREVFDMFGIRFLNHPDLRRIYMPEDFAYFPLRKEFPLLGIPGSIDLPASTPDPE